jgi:hypothetical protein
VSYILVYSVCSQMTSPSANLNCSSSRNRCPLTLMHLIVIPNGFLLLYMTYFLHIVYTDNKVKCGFRAILVN